MHTKFNFYSFKFLFGITGSFFLILGFYQLLADVIAFLFYDLDRLNGLSGLPDIMIIAGLSILLGLIFTIAVVKLLIRKDDQFSVIWGTIIAFMISLYLLWTNNVDLFLGGISFCFGQDYLNILRNLLMGFFVVIVLRVTKNSLSAKVNSSS